MLVKFEFVLEVDDIHKDLINNIDTAEFDIEVNYTDDSDSSDYICWLDIKPSKVEKVKDNE